MSVREASPPSFIMRLSSDLSWRLYAVCPDGQYSVSVLDESVQCVAGTPCSGTYSASGLVQGVGSCPSGTGCALLPETVIMGCVGSGRSDITYVNADGTLTKDGKTVSIASSTASSAASTTSTASSSSTASTTSGSTASTTSSSSGTTKSGDSSSATQTQTTTDSSTTTSPGTVEASDTSAMDDAILMTNSTSSSNSSSSSGSTSASASLGSYSRSSSGSVDVSDPSTTANAKASWGSKINDASAESNTSTINSSSDVGTIIAIVVGCLAVVAVAAGARLLRKKKDPEMTTPAAAGDVGGDLELESYGGTGMTPKENVLLL